MLEKRRRLVERRSVAEALPVVLAWWRSSDGEPSSAGQVTSIERQRLGWR